MRRAVSAVIGLAAVLGTSTAFAQEQFSDQGTLAFSADRLFGLYLTQFNADPDGPPGDVDDDAFEFGFLWHPGHGLGNFYSVPRGAIDYFVIDHLSIGGSIAYGSVDDDDDNGFENDFGAFLLAPRVGGAWMFTDWFGIWPRGGITFITGDAAGDADFNLFALTLEAALIFSPTDHLAFTVGPAFDIGLAGGYDGGYIGPGDDGDLRVHSFGILVGGLMGWVNL